MKDADSKAIIGILTMAAEKINRYAERLERDNLIAAETIQMIAKAANISEAELAKISASIRSRYQVRR